MDFKKYANAKTNGWTFRKDKLKRVSQEIIIYLLEIITAFLPVLILTFVISLYKEKIGSGTPWQKFVYEGEFLWLTITMLILFNAKAIFSNKMSIFPLRILVAITLLTIITLVSVYVFLQLRSVGVFCVENDPLDLRSIERFVYGSFIWALFINILFICIKGEDII